MDAIYTDDIVIIIIEEFETKAVKSTIIEQEKNETKDKYIVILFHVLLLWKYL
jgi:hypothetical protein